MLLNRSKKDFVGNQSEAYEASPENQERIYFFSEATERSLEEPPGTVSTPMDFSSIDFDASSGQMDTSQQDQQESGSTPSASTSTGLRIPATNTFDGLDDLPMFDFPQHHSLNPTSSSSFSSRGFGDYSFSQSMNASNNYEPFSSLDAFSPSSDFFQLYF